MKNLKEKLKKYALPIVGGLAESREIKKMTEETKAKERSPYEIVKAATFVNDDNSELWDLLDGNPDRLRVSSPEMQAHGRFTSKVEDIVSGQTHEVEIPQIILEKEWVLPYVRKAFESANVKSPRKKQSIWERVKESKLVEYTKESTKNLVSVAKYLACLYPVSTFAIPTLYRAVKEDFDDEYRTSLSDEAAGCIAALSIISLLGTGIGTGIYSVINDSGTLGEAAKLALATNVLSGVYETVRYSVKKVNARL